MSALEDYRILERKLRNTRLASCGTDTPEEEHILSTMADTWRRLDAAEIAQVEGTPADTFIATTPTTPASGQPPEKVTYLTPAGTTVPWGGVPWDVALSRKVPPHEGTFATERSLVVNQVAVGPEEMASEDIHRVIAVRALGCSDNVEIGMVLQSGTLPDGSLVLTVACFWEGTIPKRPKGMPAWARRASEAGWTPPKNRNPW